jgi:hypothetical protein
MCAHSNLTKLGDVNFYSQSTMDVTHRALRESSEDSNGERKIKPSARPCKPRSNETMFMVFPVR